MTTDPLRDFEAAWRTALDQHSPRPPDVWTYLSADVVADQDLIIELLAIDIEFRSQQAGNDAPLPLGTLTTAALRRVPELRTTADAALVLLSEEIRGRLRNGQPLTASELSVPGLSETAKRCGVSTEKLRTCVVDTVAEEEAERDPLPQPSGTRVPIEPAPDFDPQAPLPASDYHLHEFLGSGAAGKVYRATQRSLDRAVAVKFLRKSFLLDAEQVARFQAEARTVAALSHPGIVSVHGLGRAPGGGRFLVMEFLPGGDLAAVVNDSRPIEISQAIHWTIAACDAVAEAHADGIIHCDLKPANLLLDAAGRVKVTDFGLARSLRAPDRSTARIAGTAPFMAPEQIVTSWGEIDARTDVYGLGATLFTLVTGRPPWTGLRIADVAAQVVSSAQALRADMLRADIPIGLADVIATALRKQPEERFGSATELREALTSCVQ